MVPTERARLGVGELAARSAGVYARSLVPFALTSAVVHLPWITFEVWRAEQAPERQPSLDHLSTLLFELSTYALTGALAGAVWHRLRGDRVATADAVARALRRLPALLGTAALVTVRVAVWFVLFGLLAGQAAEQGGGLPALPLLLLVPAFAQIVRLYVALPAAALEGLSPRAALRRSAQLTAGARWRIFGAWFLFTLLALAVQQATSFLYCLADDAPWALFDAWEPVWLYTLRVVVVTPLAATMMTTCHYLLRRGKDQLDVGEIAEVFD